ncbi:MAG TPA: type II secretion system protein [Candidatus Saccharimonadales bacterium]|nr:type II secretion system protein [Candidatus Saccharimonadales bacterium]
MQKQRGFTVLELIIAVVFLLAAATIFYVQKRDLEVAHRDSARKTAMNEIYYNLEDVYFAANQGYPERLAADQLKGVNPESLKDPSGKIVGEYGSNYRYEPKDCTDGKCKSYTLTADLENEADFVKDSRNK